MAQAQQFIGSKISLISKSEIRYEGILYSLDLQEATISLSKVRSFGTEGRPTERPVPPKDEIYEFIIFRGSDIKGIDVVEPPNSVTEQANAGPPSDPAILEISQQYRPPANAAPGPPMHSQQQQQPQQQMSPAYASFSASGSSGMSKPAEKQQQPFSSTTAIISPLQQQHGNHQGAAVDGVENRRTDEARSTSPKPLMQGADNRQRQEGRGRGRGGQNYQHQPQRYNNNYQGGGGFNRGGRGSHRGYGPGGSGRGGSFAQTTKRTTFAEEFDFEKSNEELMKAISSMTIKTEEEPEEDKEKDDEVYYSKDNFFDNISCEALERSKGKHNRPDWRAERKLNAETFGISENRRGGGYYRGRGFYRGGGGYGYNRGGYNNRGGGGYYGGGGGYFRRGGSGNRGGGEGGGRGRGRPQEEAAASAN